MMQFEIDNRWESSYPHYLDHPKEYVVGNFVGIWWAKTFKTTPIHVGVVVSEISDLKITKTIETKPAAKTSSETLI